MQFSILKSNVAIYIFILLLATTLTGCIWSYKGQMRGGKVISKDGNICFSIDNDKDTSKYSVQLISISVTGDNKIAWEKDFDKNKEVKHITPNDCIPLPHEVKLTFGTYYSFSLRVSMDEAGGWDTLFYHGQFFLVNKFGYVKLYQSSFPGEQ
ncbi:MAG: putative T6SS immunity periplasmic lipoprotein [Enterobacteriaceae bacterium]